MTRCHFIPIIKKDDHYLFLLTETKIDPEWVTFNDITEPDESFYECAIRAVLDGTHGTLCNFKSILDEKYRIILLGDKKNDKYFFVECCIPENYIEYLNNLFAYQISKKRFIHPDDIQRARWFSIDEILSFKSVSHNFSVVLLEHLHTFRSGLHSPF